MTILAEYLWLDGNQKVRSKTRVINEYCDALKEWSYDGSSTHQATTENSEIILKPVMVFSWYDKPTTYTKYGFHFLILCEGFNTNGEPIETNSRFIANQICKKYEKLEPCYGLEQEYYLLKKNKRYITDDLFCCDEYCRTNRSSVERKIVTEHLEACIEINLNISGINGEVTESQWEFQIGPVIGGIMAADQLIVARFLLDRIAEKYDYEVSYEPKLFKNISGSGCHINFSTIETMGEGGLEYITKYVKNLEKNALKTIEAYGRNNKARLQGEFETARWDTFSWGIGTRNTSVRIPIQVARDQKGYLEDRRPGANIDPYLACSTLLLHCLE